MKKVMMLLAIFSTIHGMQQPEDKPEYKREALLNFMKEVDDRKLKTDPTMRTLMEMCCKYSFIHRGEFNIGPYN